MAIGTGILKIHISLATLRDQTCNKNRLLLINAMARCKLPKLCCVKEESRIVLSTDNELCWQTMLIEY
jgi:hypothetical protein